MITVSFIRHAKSDRSINTSDFERPLNDRGLQDAPLMGKIIQEKYQKPDLILSSPAVRAKTTAQIIAKAIDYPEKEIQYIEDLYFADTETYLDIIRKLDTDFKHIFVVSHNPGTTYIINRVSNARLDYMPTCGIAEIEFDENSWANINDKSGKIKQFDIPKNHK